MALSPLIHWDVRSGGSANNGGGFKQVASGVDYSQQNAAQYSLTGVTSVGAGAIALTASAAADMVGNVANVTGGTNFTTGRREIISVVVGVSITFDANITTGAGAAGTIEIGGSVAIPATISQVAVSGNVIYLKSGTAYTNTVTTTLNQNAFGEIRMEGYTTTHGDLGVATITSATNSVALVTANGATAFMFRAIKFTHTAGTRGAGVLVGGGQLLPNTFMFCEFDGCSTAVLDSLGASAVTMLHCRIHNCTGSGLTFGDNTVLYLYATWIHNNASHGLLSQNNTFKHIVIVRCIITNNTADGYREASNNIRQNVFIHATTFAFNANGIGQTDTSNLQRMTITSCLFYGHSARGIAWNATLAPGYMLLRNNAYGANTSGNYSSNVPAGVGDVTLSADPFTNSGAQDFTLNSTAGGGADLVGVGDPQTIP